MRNFKGVVMVAPSRGMGVYTTLKQGFKALNTPYFPVMVNLMTPSEINLAQKAIDELGEREWVVFENVSQSTPPVILKMIADTLESRATCYAVCDDFEAVDRMRTA
jgi:hypothetical protein